MLLPNLSILSTLAMDKLHEKFIREIEEDWQRIRSTQPKPLPPTKARSDCLCALRAKLYNLYHKQEYYRQAYNEVVGQLMNIAHGLPDWVFSYGQPEYPEQQTNELVLRDADYQEYEEEEEEPIEQLSPDMLNFMLQTYRHREKRDREKALAEATSIQLPPPVRSTEQSSNSPLWSKRMLIESSIANYYKNVSECREAPFWPAMPLRNVKR